MVAFTQGPPTECSLSIKNLPQEKLLFESFPDSLQEGYTARYRSQSAEGRASATIFNYYMGGEYADFGLDLIFVAGANTEGQITNLQKKPFANYNPQFEGQLEFLRDVNREVELQKMEAKVRWLEALCFPRPKVRRLPQFGRDLPGGEPPRVIVTFGSFLTIEGQVRSFDVSWKAPFDPKTARPYVGEVRLVIKRLFEFYPDWYDISGKEALRAPLSFAVGLPTPSIPATQEFQGGD